MYADICASFEFYLGRTSNNYITYCQFVKGTLNHADVCHCHKFKANLRYKLDRSLPEALKQICGSLCDCYFRILDRVSFLRRTLDHFTFTLNLL